MSLKELDIENAYDTGHEPKSVIRNFYVPVLNEAVLYRRLTGYFSSQVLALAARGIAGLIRNGGKMQLITSPVVSEEDYKALTSSDSDSVIDFVNRQFEIAMKDVNDLASVISYDHLRALGWMLREGLLEIKVLVPSEVKSGSGIFHSKVGIVQDSEGNTLTFSGSVNETAMGWSQNIEEFKVFKGWESGSESWVIHDTALFEKYWSQSKDSGFQAIELPKKSVEKLISIAPENIEELSLTAEEGASTRKPRPYQSEAVNAWVESNFRGILEMATGTGKTFTARMCIDTWKKNKNESVILVIAPTQTVASQWISTLSDLLPISTFGNRPWRELIQDANSRASLGIQKHIVIVAIQNTASTSEFIEKFNQLSNFTENRLLIADEAHGLGAKVFSKALNSSISSRLGLSATPDRWFDDEGTKVLTDYFGGVIYKFGLHEALTWVDPETGLTPLCQYNYHPIFVTLDDSELDEYLSLTKRIIFQSSKVADADSQEQLNRLQEKRALILKKAKAKLPALREVLSNFRSSTGILIYCSDTEQLNDAIDIVNEFHITYRTFTGEEGTASQREFQNKSERDLILENFENKDIQALIAMKCLDEGVDIPSAKIGIIMASTTNPKEFIQRRGRLLRRAPGKKISEIFDLIVSPIFPNDAEIQPVFAARKIFEKELNRVNEFANDASNSSDIVSKILGRMLLMGDTNES